MASADSRQFGDLATQLVQESRRSTLTDTLLKYNDSLVRTVIREQRNLEELIDNAIAAQADNAALRATRPRSCSTRPPSCATSAVCSRHVLGARAALPALLADGDLRARLSPHEVDFLREYNASVMDFRGDFSAELDVAASVTHPPRDLHALVRVVRDCGVIQTELGTIDFRKGQRFMVRRADIEHLIVQGYLEEV
ncbi:GINS complex Psf1 component [Lactarius indigo]|nr:GINS complex Psf1 component [Lactarius indigo]